MLTIHSKMYLEPYEIGNVSHEGQVIDYSACGVLGSQLVHKLDTGLKRLHVVSKK